MPKLSENLYSDRKKKIIEVAESLFFKKGFDKVTMQEIAESVGCTRKTLYSYFKCKEELFVIIHLIGSRKRIKIFDKIKSEKNNFNKLKIFAKEYKKFYFKYPQYLKLQVYWDTNGINWEKISLDLREDFIKKNKFSHNILISIFKETIKLDQKNNDYEVLVSSFFLQLRALLNQLIFNTDPFDRYINSSIYDTYIKIYVSGLEAMAEKQDNFIDKKIGE